MVHSQHHSVQFQTVRKQKYMPKPQCDPKAIKKRCGYKEKEAIKEGIIMNTWENIYIYKRNEKVKTSTVAVFSNRIGFVFPDLKVVVDDFSLHNTHKK